LLDLLSHDYSIVDADKLTPPFELRPALIGPDALANQDVTEYLVRAYRAGLTVAIVYATQQEADLFDQLVEGEQAASCLPARGASRIALYAVQRTTREQPEEVTRYCLPTVFRAGPRSDESDEQGAQSGETEEQWVTAAFGPQAPPPPLQAVDDAGGSSVNLDSLSRKTHCSEFFANANGQVQDDYIVTSGRSFGSQRDYYYVQDFPKAMSFRTLRFLQASSGTPFLQPYGSREVFLSGTRLLFTHPSTTTQYVSQYTNDRSTTVSGTVGFQGLTPDISTTVSVTVGTSTTVTVPPVTIRNTSDLALARTAWQFNPANPMPHVLYDTAENWVWSIDRNVYGGTPNEIPEVFSYFQAGTDSTLSPARCGFPTPFRTFDVAAPEITRADPPTVQSGGGVFSILGTQMYPGIVSNVLLGGDALPTANFVRINDTEIRVVVPSNQRKD
jgi:hypothetical protein